MLHTIEIYFLLFISYAFLGWCMEVTCKFIQYKKFINRGFLIGPYCPIYGWGSAGNYNIVKKVYGRSISIICNVNYYLFNYRIFN